MAYTEQEVRALIEEARVAERSGATDRALSLFSDVLPSLPDHSPAGADVLRWMGTIHRERGDHTSAADCYARSLAQAERCGYVAGRAHVVNCQAIIAHRRGHVDEALQLYALAAADAAAVEDNRLLGMIEQNIGVMHNMRGELDQALIRYRMSLRAFEEARDEEAVSWVLTNMGLLHRQRRQLVEAHEAYRRAMTIAERRGDSYTTLMLESNLALLLVDLGELAQAEALCQRVLAVAEARHDRVRQADAHRCRARLLGARGLLGDAEADLERALVLADQTEDCLLMAQILADLGGVRQRSGDRDGAYTAWTDSLDLFTKLGAAHEANEVARHIRPTPPGGSVALA